MEQYNVTGMSWCCVQRPFEKAVSKVPGVTSCSVSLLTNSMGVEGSASPADIIAAVEESGIRGIGKRSSSRRSGRPEAPECPWQRQRTLLKDKETPTKMKRRLIASLCFLIPLMVFSPWGT